MRMGIAIDAAIDLPASFLEEHRITVMPIRIQLDGKTFQDDRDPQEIARFLAQGLGSRGHAAETAPESVENVQKLFLERLALAYDAVFCLTTSRTRSAIHDHVTRASFGVLKNYHAARAAAGIGGPFLLRVIDTRNLFAGAAPLVVEATRLIAASHAVPAIRERLEALAGQLYGYLLPHGDLHFLRARARKKGDHSVGLLSAMLGSALDLKPLIRAHRGDTVPVAKVRGFEAGCGMLLDYLARRVRAGLLVPAVCISYGGDLAELPRLRGYADLQQACAERGVALLEAPMSLTGMVNAGVGALAVGFAAEEHEPLS